jgi:hypothetical protein
MTPEEKELLKRIAENVEENNEMLHAIRRSMRWSSIMRWVYWILIIGASVGSLWIIQPYLNSLNDTYSNAQSSVSTLKDLVGSYK